MSGKRFNPSDISTKIGGAIAALSVVAPQVASVLGTTNPGLANKITIGGLLIGALLGAKKGR